MSASATPLSAAASNSALKSSFSTTRDSVCVCVVGGQYCIAKIIVDARICCLRVSRWVVGGAWSSVVLRDAFSSFRVAMLSRREVCREEHIVTGIATRTSLLRPLRTMLTPLPTYSLPHPLTPPPTHSLPTHSHHRPLTASLAVSLS